MSEPSQSFVYDAQSLSRLATDKAYRQGLFDEAQAMAVARLLGLRFSDTMSAGLLQQLYLDTADIIHSPC